MELAVNTSYNPQVGLTAPRHGFRHGRYFFDSQGWYVRLRPGDEQLLERIRVRIAERGVDALVVGPFPTRRSPDVRCNAGSRDSSSCTGGIVISTT
jgi:hypothetical protein